MSRHFVLDENIVILAQTGQDEHGSPDPTCQQLLREIVRNCHSVVFSQLCWQQYASQLNSLAVRRRPATVGVLALLNDLLRNSATDNRPLADQECVDVPDLDGMAGVDIGDRPFVRAAASVDVALLVTTDGSLLEAVTSAGLDSAYGFSS